MNFDQASAAAPARFLEALPKNGAGLVLIETKGPSGVKRNREIEVG